MRYLRIIVIALAVGLASACIDNLECPTPGVNNSDEITLIGRVTRFDDYNVATRAAKQGDESKISSYAMAIFHVENDEATDCVYYEYHSSGNQLLFTIERPTSRYETGDKYAIYVFANMPGMEEFQNTYTTASLNDMLSKRYDIVDLDIPDNGFPMIGSLGDYFSTDIDMDGKEFVMSPTTGEEPPRLGSYVDGELVWDEVTTLNVPMKALYAKMNFHIEVRPDQMIEGSSFPPQFELKSYKLVNVPASVDFNKSTNADSDVEGAENNVGVLSDITFEMGSVASGARAIDFSFYLPENLLVPDTDTSNYSYPFKGTHPENLDKDKNGIRDEDEKYRQRYKGKLLGDGQPATNIVLSGEFRDHQNHSVKVDYTIHLGKDNYGDFNIVRNCEYNNDITIRGILNSNDNGDNYISLDHRVNVEHKEPTIISLRREVLLDSHFEIRPLRVKYNSDFEGADAKYVKVEVVNPGTTTWMRLERSSGVGSDYAGKTNSKGESIYITEEGSSKGKRRYFTTDLVSGGANATANYSLVNSTSVTVPIPTQYGDDQCVWIYVDECTEVGDAVRSGVIRVTYLDSNQYQITGDENYPQIDYTINQRKLFRVHYQDTVNTSIVRPYDIEYHEEYLHNFDSDDTFGQTHYEGMQWGAENVQFSKTYPAVYLNLEGGFLSAIEWLLNLFGWDISEWTNSVMDSIIEDIKPYYDFYMTRDQIALGVKADNPNVAGYDGIVIRDYSGHAFSQELITKLKSVGKLSDGTLASVPQSAVEYCYHKNKRDIDGNVTNPQWYLPAVDEIEEIVTSKYKESENLQVANLNTYARFSDFQAKFYWSSQPAYIQNEIELEAYSSTATGKTFVDNTGSAQDNDPGSARATSVSYSNGKYSSVKSGLSGAAYKYSYTQNRNGQLSEPEIEFVSPSPKPDAGYKPRTAMARVRCVRKMD